MPLRRHDRRSNEPWWRTCIAALVLIGHLGLLLIMLQPPMPRNIEGSVFQSPPRDVMAVRWVRRPAARPSITPLPSQSGKAGHAAALHHTALARAMPSAQPIEVQAPLLLAPPASSASTYVAGGSPFQQRLHSAEHPFLEKVPGADQPRAPRFRMADPRQQGIAGAVRLVQGLLLHAVDPHCVDLDTWAGMPPAERAQHASPSEIDALREKYGCLEADRFPGTTR